MDIKDYFPIWDKLTDIQQQRLASSAVSRKFSKNDILHNGSAACTGLILINESAIEDTDTLNITHEAIGNHLGNPREVVTRMLKYFANEGVVSLSRGTITILDKTKLSGIVK